MPDTHTPTAPARIAPHIAGSTEFAVLVSRLASIAIEASDAGDNAEFDRAMAYRAAVKRIADRWAAGERSPTRAVRAAAEVEG